MLKNLSVPLVGILCLLLVAPSLASERGSIEEAKAMALHAANALRSLGTDAAFEAFQAPGPPFHDRDLYIFVLNRDGIVQAHGIDPALAGQSRLDVKDSKDRTFVREIVAMPDQGWVNYLYADPFTGKILPKQTYVVRVGDYLVCVGAYAEESESEAPPARQPSRSSKSR
ncbi:MAG: cache domain-containing protein [Defluviicoccus sp.]|nr:cache domain-containing protein [Defluviicoccus sp.]MDG4593198.1 cache domain-containing protein [Defluviicoccus sp.]MDS4010608.1 cache domain-containing protein [Defluviicoccus sp.]MDS4072457.1 cache domain-containing protein [Defluviicoccus sp.]